jgi:hypothetical protein
MSKRVPQFRNPVEEIKQKKQQARALDKMHVERLVKAMTGTLVAFAFDDDQACRAAAYLLARCARAKPLSRDEAMDLAGRAVDAAAADDGPARQLVDLQ